MSRPAVLDGQTVVEYTHSLGGALCGRLLAEFGADVVLVEPPSGHALRGLDPEDDAHVFEIVAAGKRSIVVEDRDEARLADLLGGADVFLTDRRGLAAGLDAEAVGRYNADLIYCSVTPFGRAGRNAGREGEDPTVQAMSGLAATTGFPGRPPAVTAAPVAAAMGAIVGCGSVLLQVFDRSDGRIDVSAQDAVMPLLTTFLPEFFATGESVEAIGNHHPIIAPWNTYRARDDWVFFIGLTDRDWERFLAMADRDDLRDDPRFESAHKRRQHVDEIDAIVGEWISRYTVEEVIDLSDEYDLTAAPIHDVVRAFEDGNLEYRNMVIESNGHTIAGSPFAMSRSPGRVASPAPDLGERGGGDA